MLDIFLPGYAQLDACGHFCRHNAHSVTVFPSSRRFAIHLILAVQVFGGYGYLKEYRVERVWRDLRVHRLLEGTNEIMNVIIARELMKS
jgi:hypothetical protein